MDFNNLNPFVRHIGVYEVINNKGECISYDARLLYTVSGDLTVSIGGEKKTHLGCGQLLYIPAGTKYALKGEYFRTVIVNFDLTDSFCDRSEKILPVTPENFRSELLHADSFAPFDKPIFVDDMESQRDLFLRLCNIAISQEGLYRAELSAYIKIILLKVSETVSDNALPLRMVENLDSYIRENCSEEISNTEIGAIFGYHPFYVSRMLKEKKGITLRQYIISYRLKASKKLLESTKKSMSEIADETGFTDASYFTKTFKATFGMTPKEYRNNFKDNFI